MSKKKTQKFFIGEGELEREVRPAKLVGINSGYMATEYLKRDLKGKEVESGLLLDENDMPVSWSFISKIAVPRKG
jgi:hypothetical protein